MPRRSWWGRGAALIALAIVGAAAAAAVVAQDDGTPTSVHDEPVIGIEDVTDIVGQSCAGDELRRAAAVDGSAVLCAQDDVGWHWEVREPPDDRPLVVYYSDSLGVESATITRFVLGERVELVHRGYPGSALCDWTERIEQDVDRWQPDLVVAEFIGNTMTPCMGGWVDGRGLPEQADYTVAQYERDARHTEDLLADRQIPLVWLRAPLSLVEPIAEVQVRVEAIFAEGAATRPLVEIADPGAVLESPGGLGVATMPCAPWETAELGCDLGTIAVRHTDGIHLCSGGGGESCGVYAAGQFRFGAAVAEAILGAL